MNRRSFFQRLGMVAGAGVVGDPVAAQQLCDGVAVQRPSIDETLYERMVIGNEVWDVIPKFVRGHTTVLLSGEPGSDRTLAARVVHARSPWADAPLLALDCSLPGTIGRALAATRGTVVLENVHALYLSEQNQLLEQMREYRLGDRLICTTTTPMLTSLVDCGIFSEEFYYRINVISLELQPLRERPDVILPLAACAATRAAAAQNKLVPQITPPGQLTCFCDIAGPEMCGNSNALWHWASVERDITRSPRPT